VLLSRIALGKRERMHRTISGVLGLLLIIAGLVASGYIETNLKGDTFVQGAAGILVPGVLMASAWYMAYVLLRFAITGKKEQ
jgi:glucose uptake protein GlcU